VIHWTSEPVPSLPTPHTLQNGSDVHALCWHVHDEPGKHQNPSDTLAHWTRRPRNINTSQQIRSLPPPRSQGTDAPQSFT
jgi:hypothetical protein